MAGFFVLVVIHCNGGFCSISLGLIFIYALESDFLDGHAVFSGMVIFHGADGVWTWIS